MADRQYTIMIAPGSSARLLRLKLSRRAAHACAFAAALVVSGAALLPIVGYSALETSRELEQLRLETEALKQEAAKIGELRKQVALFEERASKLALMAGVSSLSPTPQPGAPESQAVHESQAAMDQSAPEESPATEPDAPTGELGDLQSRSSVLIRNFEELDRAYETRSAQLSATPSIAPVRGMFGGGFAYRKDPFTGMRAFHGGLDIVAPEGSPIRAPADGRVIFSGRESGYGNAIYIAHGRGLTTRYAHLERLAARVGDRVIRGDIIGYVGDTGRSLGAHLHYEVLLNNARVDPSRYILDDAVSY